MLSFVSCLELKYVKTLRSEFCDYEVAHIIFPKTVNLSCQKVFDHYQILFLACEMQDSVFILNDIGKIFKWSIKYPELFYLGILEVYIRFRIRLKKSLHERECFKWFYGSLVKLFTTARFNNSDTKFNLGGHLRCSTISHFPCKYNGTDVLGRKNFWAKM